MELYLSNILVSDRCNIDLTRFFVVENALRAHNFCLFVSFRSQITCKLYVQYSTKIKFMIHAILRPPECLITFPSNLLCMRMLKCFIQMNINYIKIFALFSIYFFYIQNLLFNLFLNHAIWSIFIPTFFNLSSVSKKSCVNLFLEMNRIFFRTWLDLCP